MFSPRMWRCFIPAIARPPFKRVFSTHVEMFPKSSRQTKRRSGFLHACGDVSQQHHHPERQREFSPRMWRCFLCRRIYSEKVIVFSTHVEMFLIQAVILSMLVCFLHACGDVSIRLEALCLLLQFSPRMWRCFLLQRRQGGPCDVFSTHVEMFPQNRLMRLQNLRFLHACGDVSLTL